MRYVVWTFSGIVGLLGIFIIFGSWYTVDQGERGVVLRNGAFQFVAEPGLHFKLPIIDDVVDMSIRTEKIVYEKVQAYSRDIQAAELQISVNYRLDPSSVSRIYETLGTGYIDRVVTPELPKRVKEVFGQYQAASVVADRARLGVEIEDAIRESVVGRGIIIESVQMENVDFSDAYEGAIESAMQAQAEVQKVRQELERQKVNADKVRADAAGAADAVREKARAEADAIRLRGNAEAEAIAVRAKALADNPLLIQLTIAEKWGGVLPTTMIPNGSVPLLSVK